MKPSESARVQATQEKYKAPWSFYYLMAVMAAVVLYFAALPFFV